MIVIQKEVVLRARRRGFYLVTPEILSQLPNLKSIHAGVLHIFVKHTSASLTVNENADPAVRNDFEKYFTHAIPDGASYIEHDTEGDDDMPAHLKASLSVIAWQQRIYSYHQRSTESWHMAGNIFL
jgi:secondary thiamine-phosphate synthase enzyme